jgi:bifunctional non-homologous end joining protein LigD
MLAARSDSIFSDPDWLFEPKLDGYRIITHLNDGTLRLLSRNGIDVTARYATIHAPLSRQPASQLLLDGEIVALDARGRPCFQCLQDYQEFAAVAEGRGGDGTAIIYYIFDILYLDGYDLHAVPLIQRKGILARVLQPSGAVRSIAYFEGGGEVVYRSAIDQGFEGVIAKRRESTYEAGRRSSNWLKIKSTVTEEFIVGGYTLGSGNRARTFGALVLGYFDDERKRLIPVGSVGTGFDENTLNGMKKRLDAIEAEECPFAVVPELDTPATWVRPELVVEIQFSEWTHDQQLRTPVYLRLRGDKPADQVAGIQVFAKPVAPLQEPALSPQGDMVADLVERLKNGRDIFSIEIEGHTVSLSNLSKALWPPFDDSPALTKRDLLTYLLRVSPYLLEHLRDRPLTLSRYPDGIGGEQFYQKHWHTPLPQFVETAALSERHQRGQHYLLCNNLPTLLWLGQAAVLELHTWFSSVSPAVEGEAAGDPSADDAADRITHYPDFVVFDLDPYIYAGSEPPGAEPQLNRAAFDATCEAALWLKETLDALGLRSFVKSSGRTGLHIYVPLRRQFDYRAVHSAAKTICQFVLQRHPRELTVDWPVERRTGRVFLDYNQNVRGKTLASIYSPRAAPEATVSTPLLWEELSRVYPTDFTIRNLPARLARIGDLWADILSSRSSLKEVLDASR